ncbi:MAG: DnaJ domain-containing protein [SAR324 cluster bacterium]|nr:DnaJ domain-containing protein [SAR324 cluster bacterium]
MENRLHSGSAKKKRKGRRKAPPSSVRPHIIPEQAEELDPGKDYTPDILEFLYGMHGNIRVDGAGDYYYESVSTISLHFLLKSRLPAKEMLWRWYQHFEQERSESIYQTLPPQRDEEFLQILEGCAFRWNAEAVRESGLVFLSQHRTEVYLALEEILAMRLDEFETLDDAQLAELLRPGNTWSDRHLQRLMQSVQTQPLSLNQRQSIYAQLESDYLKATARHLIDETQNEAFWKASPPELEALHSRFIIFARTMTNTARRLGVYISRKSFEEEAGARAWGQAGDGYGRRQSRAPRRMRNSKQPMEQSYFDALGLPSSANLAEVKLAYRNMVKQHHPDQGGSVQDFLRLQEAYEYLLTQVF